MKMNILQIIFLNAFPYKPIGINDVFIRHKYSRKILVMLHMLRRAAVNSM